MDEQAFWQRVRTAGWSTAIAEYTTANEGADIVVDHGTEEAVYVLTEQELKDFDDDMAIKYIESQCRLYRSL